MSHMPNNQRALEVKVISSQHCIEVEGQQIELIYLFQSNTLQVHFNDRLILNTQMAVNKTQVNYANLIEVAITYFNRELKRMKEELKQLEQQQQAEEKAQHKQDFKAYIMNSITTVIE